MKKIILLPIFFVFSILGAQSSFIKIETIQVEGNKRTKEFIVLRELNLAVGDTITLGNVEARLNRNRNQLLNTGLFTEVELKIEDWDKKTGRAKLHILLQENVPIYPYAWASLLDVDFNVWKNVHNSDLSRTQPYLGFKHINLTGRQDKLSLYLQAGFTNQEQLLRSTFLRKVQAIYTSPYLNKAQTLRANGNIFVSNERSIRVNTFNNRDSFLRSDNSQLLIRVRLESGIDYRPGLYEQHEFRIGYFDRSFNAALLDLDDNYFFGGQNRQQFLSLSYRFISDRRDFQLYAKSGYFLDIGLTKEGLGIWGDRNALIFDAEFSKYWSFNSKLSLEVTARGRTNLQRETIDYYNLPVVGPKPEVVRGYITQHIRGSDFAFLKSSFRYQVLNLSINLGKYMPIKAYRNIPMQVYLKLNNDLAYIRTAIGSDASNTLINRRLYGRGVGIDIVTANLSLLELMYNFNDLGERQFDFHFYYAF
ncbi:MAG: POTRA domain-containing protein [Bacteroidota bacterium]